MKAYDHLILLGMKATDQVTGMTGVITMITFDLYGCIQVLIQPKVTKAGKVPDTLWLDLGRVEAIKSVIEAVHPAHLETALGYLGLKGKDLSTNRKGVVTSVLVHMNGGIEYAITPKCKPDGEYVTGKYAWDIACMIRDDQRVMDAPDFAEGKVADAEKGPAEKPERPIY